MELVPPTLRNKIFQKSFEKPLDKPHKVCYNKYVIKRSHLLKSRKELISMAKKMTIVEQYEAIIAKAKDFLTAEEIEFLEKRAELHSKKNASRSMTATQKANEDIKTKILEGMNDNQSYSVGEIQKMVGLESNQKTSALLRQLKEAGLVVRSEVKGKAYFTKA